MLTDDLLESFEWMYDTYENAKDLDDHIKWIRIRNSVGSFLNKMDQKYNEKINYSKVFEVLTDERYSKMKTDLKYLNLWNELMAEQEAEIKSVVIKKVLAV